MPALIDGTFAVIDGNPAEMPAGERVEIANRMLTWLGLDLYDLELHGYIETLFESDPGLTVSVREAYERLVAEGFNLGFEVSHVSEHYFEQGRAAVRSALEERTLLREDDE